MPRHTHDCGECVFLGEYVDFDLYCCAGATLFARYGSVPGDCITRSAERAPGGPAPITEAARLARARGLL